MEKRMGTLKEICAIYGWKARTVREWVYKGLFPAPYLHGRTWRFDLPSVDRWAHQEKLQVEPLTTV